MNNEITKEALTSHFGKELGLSSVNGSWRISTPFYDPEGSPITIRITAEPDGFVLDDMGQISGLLFSMGQESTSSPSYAFVSSLAQAHDVEVNLDNGTLVAHSSPQVQELNQRLFELISVLITIQCSLPHLPARRKKAESLGPRLATRAAGLFHRWKILKQMQRRVRVSGLAVESWHVDYSYRAGPSGLEVFMATVDLDVVDPLPKAEHVIAMALDVRGAHEKAKVRVLYDRHGKNSSTAQAAHLIQGNSDLGYETYDFASQHDITSLRQGILQELTPAEQSWRNVFG